VGTPLYTSGNEHNSGGDEAIINKRHIGRFLASGASLRQHSNYTNGANTNISFSILRSFPLSGRHYFLDLASERFGFSGPLSSYHRCLVYHHTASSVTSAFL
jgi:hypothetical protein